VQARYVPPCRASCRPVAHADACAPVGLQLGGGGGGGGADSDDDVVMQAAVLPLRCPLTAVRICTPAHFIRHGPGARCVMSCVCKCVSAAAARAAAGCGVVRRTPAAQPRHRPSSRTRDRPHASPPPRAAHPSPPLPCHTHPRTALACFDLEAFLQLAQRTGKLKCPISSTLATLEDLRVRAAVRTCTACTLVGRARAAHASVHVRGHRRAQPCVRAAWELTCGCRPAAAVPGRRRRRLWLLCCQRCRLQAWQTA
jgi:hypothetical protein